MNPEIITVPLTQGKVAVIDAIDAPEILKYKWFAVKASRGIFYAARRTPQGRIHMHNQIMGMKWVDQKDYDGLNN